MSEYYIRIGGEHRGPFSRAQLESQPMSESTPVRQDGTDQWRSASDFPELAGLFRGSLDQQYGSFRDRPEASPYASPQAHASPTVTAGTIPKVMGMVSCGIGILSWLSMFGFFGFVAYFAIKQEQDGAEPLEAIFFTIGLSFCFCFLLMLAGVLVGIVGVAIPGSGKGWSLAGLILCGLPLLLLLGLFLLGAAIS
ncbi:DUF4339 domain-containing protein [Blastopirellula retiformator]|uniref:GYF domain-containing protein n=1 Tax=Blastopirellula retiformator TaxID=2527970 RepID=A0A5C5UWP6_9BACT|nr:DUF4339 domain-containing protein [Blastopirellula retiformator]TWT30794.1 hypothetical protein Enr8_43190 [Blastopirellula retiformator]